MTNKTVRDAVVQYNGVWEHYHFNIMMWLSGGIDYGNSDDSQDQQRINSGKWQLVCTRAQFEAEADVWRREKELVQSYDKMMGKKPRPEVGESYQTSFGPVEVLVVDRGSFRVCVRREVSGLHLLGYEQLLPLKTEKERAVDELVGVIVDHYEHPKGAEQYIKLAESIIKAGYRKQEEDQ